MTNRMYALNGGGPVESADPQGHALVQQMAIAVFPVVRAARFAVGFALPE